MKVEVGDFKYLVGLAEETSDLKALHNLEDFAHRNSYPNELKDLVESATDRVQSIINK